LLRVGERWGLMLMKRGGRSRKRARRSPATLPDCGIEKPSYLTTNDSFVYSERGPGQEFSFFRRRAVPSPVVEKIAQSLFTICYLRGKSDSTAMEKRGKVEKAKR
jgi:hypothetical protein